MEIGVIRRILKKAKLWHFLAADIRPLRERHNIGRAMLQQAMLQQEKLRLLKIVASRPDWQGAYCAAVLALNMTMRGCEVKALCWRDIDFLNRTLTVRRSKTEEGERLIPLKCGCNVRCDGALRKSEDTRSCRSRSPRISSM
jgi:integrase